MWLGVKVKDRSVDFHWSICGFLCCVVWGVHSPWLPEEWFILPPLWREVRPALLAHPKPNQSVSPSSLLKCMFSVIFLLLPEFNVTGFYAVLKSVILYVHHLKYKKKIYFKMTKDAFVLKPKPVSCFSSFLLQN